MPTIVHGGGYQAGYDDGYAAGKVKLNRYYGGGVSYSGSPHTVTIANCDSGNTSTKLVVIAEFSCGNIGNTEAKNFANHVFTFQGSNDKSTWTNLYSNTRKRPRYSTVTHKGALFKMDTNYRYFRVTFSSNDVEKTAGNFDCYFYVYQ